MEVFSFKLPEVAIPAIRCQLSFEPYLRYIEEQVQTTKSGVYKEFLSAIVKLLKANLELLSPIEDLQILDANKELLELLKITHLSQIKGDNKLHALGIPSGASLMMNFFSASDDFKSFFSSKSSTLNIHSEVELEQIIRESYQQVLAACYNIGADEDKPQSIVHIVDNSSSVKKYYQIIKRNNFVDILPIGELPDLKQEWIDYSDGLIDSYKDLENPLPFDKFIIQGFFMFSIEEDTEDVALFALSDIVAKMHTYDRTESFVKMKEASLSLLGNNNIDIGFLPFLKVNNDYVYHQEFSQISILFNVLKKHMSYDELQLVFNFVANKSIDLPSILSSLNSDICDNLDCENAVNINKIISKEGINSLTFVPIWNQNALLGVVEIVSNTPNQIDKFLLKKIESAAPLYKEYFFNMINEFDEFIKSFIMQKYTSIQPEVSWKFNESVWNVLKNLNSEEEAIGLETPQIKFENLHPFYGAIDFRNSSVKQLQAIHSDYLLQLDYLKTLLQEDALLENEIVNETIATIESWEQRIEEEIDIEEEYELRRFLERDSISLLKELDKQKIISNNSYKDYIKDAKSKNGIFHLSHNDYENSMQKLNSILKDELNKSQTNLANIIPHYFEKFQTDGIEYSLYVGSNINPKKDFPSNAIDIVAEWQIETMLRIANAAYRYKNRVSIPLETTQLILLHENNVDISYRIDEKHFDVEGSYSIRYEVVKKRIDKVKLLNSNERLTQPGKIAIVYAHKESCRPYLNKINEMIADGSLHSKIEYVELEQLQSIGKLKAIRVAINTEHNAYSDEVKEVQVDKV